MIYGLFSYHLSSFFEAPSQEKADRKTNRQERWTMQSTDKLPPPSDATKTKARYPHPRAPRTRKMVQFGHRSTIYNSRRAYVLTPPPSFFSRRRPPRPFSPIRTSVKFGTGPQRHNLGESDKSPGPNATYVIPSTLGAQVKFNGQLVVVTRKINK